MISKVFSQTKGLKSLNNIVSFNFGSPMKVVFMRHGESVWNKENRFTGWVDVPLSPKGIEEARSAGKTLAQNGYVFDQVFTSVLTRAITTYNYAAEEMKCHNLPVTKSWRLNERHYGALAGLNKAETAAKHGEDQVKIWRRSFDTPPPPLSVEDEHWPGKDPKYKNVPPDALPLTECLKDSIARVIPYWHDQIAPAMMRGDRVLVVAHGNSIRSIVKYIDNISDEDIMGVNIPTSIPLVYEFDENVKPIKNYYLADPEELEKKMNAVSNQGKAK